MKTYGEVIKEGRKKHELTMEQLARRCRTHKGYISGIENGKVAPPAAPMSKKLAKNLGISVTHLILLAHCEKAPKEVRAWIMRDMRPSLALITG